MGFEPIYWWLKVTYSAIKLKSLFGLKVRNILQNSFLQIAKDTLQEL